MRYFKDINGNFLSFDIALSPTDVKSFLESGMVEVPAVEAEAAIKAKAEAYAAVLAEENERKEEAEKEAIRLAQRTAEERYTEEQGAHAAAQAAALASETVGSVFVLKSEDVTLTQGEAKGKVVKGGNKTSVTNVVPVEVTGVAK